MRLVVKGVVRSLDCESAVETILKALYDDACFRSQQYNSLTMY